MLRLISKSRVSSLAFRPRPQRRALGKYSYVGDGLDCHPKHQTTWGFLVKKFQGPPKPGTLILVRHGESEWNQKRLFTGWVDVDLSDRGIREIEHASRLLLERGYTVDVTYTSVLKRAVRSSWIMLNEINQIYRPVKKSWRLNERMYGALEGHSKVGLANLYGNEVVQKWRAGLADKPPPMSTNHPYWHGHERKYATIPSSCIPTTESLQDTIDRTLPLWESSILPDLKAGRNVLIVAHRNSIRGILKHIDGINTEDIQQVSVPNGIPLVYKFDSDMRPVVHKNAEKPLSGIWLGKMGLLRAALDQEAELAQRIEGYSYALSGNKYDTRTFYYHAPYANYTAAGGGKHSRYSARYEPETDDFLAPAAATSESATFSQSSQSSQAAQTSKGCVPQSKGSTSDLTSPLRSVLHYQPARSPLSPDPSISSAASAASTQTSSFSSSGGGAGGSGGGSGGDGNTSNHPSAEEQVLNLRTEAVLDGTYGGSDAHLVRKLIMLEQERKMFELIDDKDKASIPSPDIYDSYQKYNNSNIFIDPMVFKYGIPEHVRQADWAAKAHLAATSAGNSASTQNQDSPVTKAQEKVDGEKLNRIGYFVETSRSSSNTAAAATAAGTSRAAPADTMTTTMATTANNSVVTATTVASTTTAPQQQRAPEMHPLLRHPVLVIIRHGKTEHNKLGLFTGWEDAALSPEGRVEARIAGKLLRQHGVKFDLVYTSWLSRAIETAWLVMNELDSLWMPLIKTWRLNERMYGALTGLSKKMIRQIYGEAQFKLWRRGYDQPPPPISSFSSAYPGNDGRYVKYVHDMPISFFETCIRSLAHGELEIHRAFPKAESLKDCMERTIPFYMKEIEPDSLQQGKNVLIASSENAIRGLLMHLCKIPSDRIQSVEIPTGLPLVYDSQLGKIRLLQEEDSDGQCISGAELLQKYNFGDSPELLFELDKVDIPLLTAVEVVDDNATSSNSRTQGGVHDSDTHTTKA